MTWFKVDDSFHAHPKVLATDPAALGLWVVAGAWSSAHLTDGVVPDHALSRLLPDSATLATKLVAAGLWRRVRGGYQFHDWSAYQPSSSDVRALREKRAAAGRIGGTASARTRKRTGNEGATSGLRTDLEGTSSARRASFEGAGKSATTSTNDRSKPRSKTQALASPTVQPPTRPSPSTKEKGSGAPAAAGGARPPCPRHRGQYADTCGLCRSEALAREEDDD